MLIFIDGADDRRVLAAPNWQAAALAPILTTLLAACGAIVGAASDSPPDVLAAGDGSAASTGGGTPDVDAHAPVCATCNGATCCRPSTCHENACVPCGSFGGCTNDSDCCGTDRCTESQRCATTRGAGGYSGGPACTVGTSGGRLIECCYGTTCAGRAFDDGAQLCVRNDRLPPPDPLGKVKTR